MLTAKPPGLGTKPYEQKASQQGQQDAWSLVLTGATEKMQDSGSVPPTLPYPSIAFFTHSIKTYRDLIVPRSIQSRNKPSQAYLPVAIEAGARVLQFPSLFGLHSEFKAGLGDFLRSCLKAKTKTWAGIVAQWKRFAEPE